MNHGQTNPKFKQSPVAASEQYDQSEKVDNVAEKDEKTRIITVNTTSLTQQNLSSGTSEHKSCEENSCRIINCHKVSTPSRPVFFWEVLMTVALLIMALWMQGLPARHIPNSIERDIVPSFDITKPQMEF